MARRCLLLLISTLILITRSTQIEFSYDYSTTTPSATTPSQVVQDEEAIIAHAVNEFGYKLTLNMMKKDNSRNVVIAPTGIVGLLAMTLLGTVGTTYQELAKTLGFSQDILENRKNHEHFGRLLEKLNEHPSPGTDIADQTEGATLVPSAENKKAKDTGTSTNTTVSASDLATRTLYADAIIVDAKTRIRNIYRQYLSSVYKGDAISVNIGDKTKTLQQINDWVKQHTEGKIEEFMQDPLPVNTKAVLLSALYFSGQWERPFLEEFTKSMPFLRPSGNVVADFMLNLGKFNYTFKVQHGAHLLAIPYNGRETIMYILKPNKKPLQEVMEGLDYETINNLINNMAESDCIIRFPKMDLKTKVNLKTSLQDLGLKSLFAPGDANFALMVDPLPQDGVGGDELLTRIYEGEDSEPKKLMDVVSALPNPGIHVDSVLHDVKMTLNEYGTIAVAATSGVLSRTAKLLYLDSPFYMFIRNERTKLVTFSAVIFDPTNTS